MTTNEKLKKLRNLMADNNIDIYLVPTDDYHLSEYVGDYFKERAFLTGFTGSAGCAVVMKHEAHLWTDGRYFIQAAKQIEGSEFVLERSNEKGVPTISEFIQKELKPGMTLGFDGRCVSEKTASEFRKIAKDNDANISSDYDLVGEIWDERPKLIQNSVWHLGDKYSGESAESKLGRIREKMCEHGAQAHIISSLYDIAWILNLRGSDIENVPVFLSFLLIYENSAVLFANPVCFDDKLVDYLAKINVKLRPYEDIYSYLEAETMNEGKKGKANKADTKVLLDTATVNSRIVSIVSAKGTIIDEKNPSEKMKAVKNKTEIENTIEAHVKDGVAMVKFLKWLKEYDFNNPLTEIEASDYVEARRREQEDFLDLSFGSICAYGPNAAMMHYSAKPESQAVIKNEGLLLLDSGAHYLQGTTDITRTFVMGALTDEMKEGYTATLRAHLRLMSAQFLDGTRGCNLDILARGPLWDMLKDYRCGTGHGVGHILNVHEGPNSFRWQTKNGIGAVLEPGMITTDEPGIYEEGKFGIRIENELLCVEKGESEYGRFLGFEPITYCPIDLEPVIRERLTQYEIETLNDYHKLVYDKLSPYLDEDEKAFLCKVTEAI